MTRTFSFFLMGILNQSEGVSGLSDVDALELRGVCCVDTKEGAEAARRGGSGVDGVPEAAAKTKIYDDEAGDRNSISPVVCNWRLVDEVRVPELRDELPELELQPARGAE